MIPAPLEQLIKLMSRLPGLGQKSAQRLALHLLTQPSALHSLQTALREVAGRVETCTVCHNIGLSSPCHVCSDSTRDGHVLCVVEGVDDLWALERSGAYRGQYHVLGGVVNALDGVGPQDINVGSLLRRLNSGIITEVILALGASVHGQTTAHLLARQIRTVAQEYGHSINVTTLAKGIPMGAEVDYLDEGTLSLALQGRQQF